MVALLDLIYPQTIQADKGRPGDGTPTRASVIIPEYDRVKLSFKLNEHGK